MATAGIQTPQIRLFQVFKNLFIPVHQHNTSDKIRGKINGNKKIGFMPLLYSVKHKTNYLSKFLRWS